mgnify:CR=1 FL=1
MPVESTEDLLQAMLAHCDAQDIIIQAAAPADYRFEAVSDRKLKKQAGEALHLTLVENPDVAKTVAERKRAGQTLIGFAAETNDALDNAREKLKRKGLDMIVLNDVTQPGAGFHVDTNRVTIVSKDGESALPLMSKRELADRILNDVVALIEQGERV